ncbi:MAG: C40 family peptidase [Proteobacteria bacterium]|nr:C40 family peptidase [Pseudomonadota bacterium]
MSKNRLRVGTQVRRVGSVVLCAAALGSAWAAPNDPPADPVNRFLVDKQLIGLLSASDVPALADPLTAAPVVAPTAAAIQAPAATPDLVAPAPAEHENEFVRRVRDGASDMVMTAMNFLGVPYRRGGVSAEKGFDCSGFTRHIFEMSLGLVLPRRADEQAHAQGLVAIKRDDLKPGDLVFFNTMRRTFSHVGIYIGDGKFIHSPKPGGEVRVDDLSFAYWNKRYTGARRLDAPDAIERLLEGPSRATAIRAVN